MLHGTSVFKLIQLLTLLIPIRCLFTFKNEDTNQINFIHLNTIAFKRFYFFFKTFSLPKNTINFTHSLFIWREFTICQFYNLLNDFTFCGQKVRRVKWFLSLSSRYFGWMMRMYWEVNEDQMASNYSGYSFWSTSCVTTTIAQSVKWRWINFSFIQHLHCQDLSFDVCN